MAVSFSTLQLAGNRELRSVRIPLDKPKNQNLYQSRRPLQAALRTSNLSCRGPTQNCAPFRPVHRPHITIPFNVQGSGMARKLCSTPDRNYHRNKSLALLIGSLFMKLGSRRRFSFRRTLPWGKAALPLKITSDCLPTTTLRWEVRFLDC
jgi:hypothetical protein